MKIIVSGIRPWLSKIPIADPIEKRMASLVQVLLLGFMAIILIAAAINLIIVPDIAFSYWTAPNSSSPGLFSQFCAYYYFSISSRRDNCYHKISTP
jgi:hypothetical protein